MIPVLAAVLLLYAASASVYGAVHWRVMARAESIPVTVRATIAVRERVVVPSGLVAAAGALVAATQGCHLALTALAVAAAVSALLDGGIAAALVVAGRTTAPTIERVHLLAGAGALGGGGDLLDRLDAASRAARERATRSRPPHPEA